MIHLSGQIGTTTMSPPTLIAGGIEAETRQALENIKSVLDKNGATLDDIVKCTVMMADMREWAAMNTVYASYFPKHKPARSSFGTSGLALGARVEIECTAYRP
jgi:reactive intermediate/imine deaminase